LSWAADASGMVAARAKMSGAMRRRIMAGLLWSVSTALDAVGTSSV
jgi:hypothetical protein